MRNSKCNQAFCILFVKAGKYSKVGQYSSEEKFTHTHTHTHTHRRKGRAKTHTKTEHT